MSENNNTGQTPTELDKRFKEGKITLTLGEILAIFLDAHKAAISTGVTGGGIGKFNAYLENYESALVDPSPTEISGVATGYGYQKSHPDEVILALHTSTHGIGFNQSFGSAVYGAHKAYLPTLSVIGANVNGETGPTNFQNTGDLGKYNEIYEGRIFEIKKESDPKKYFENIINQFKPMLGEMLLYGKQGLLSVPYNLTSEKITLTEQQFYELATPPNLAAKPLTDLATKALDKLFNAYQEQGTELLYLLGAGAAHANRLSGGEFLPDFILHSNTGMVGNVVANIDNAELLANNPLGLVPPSHVMDFNINDNYKKYNTLVAIGGGSDAAITFNRAGLLNFQGIHQKEKFYLIENDPARIAEWKEEFPNAIIIEADPRSALDYLKQKQYSQDQWRERYEPALNRSIELREATINGKIYTDAKKGNESQPNTELRELHKQISKMIEDLIREHGNKVALVIDSGNSSGKLIKQLALGYGVSVIDQAEFELFKENVTTALKFHTKKDHPSIIYPPEGELGKMGAMIGAIQSKKFDVVIGLSGDGGAGYMSVGELAKIQEAAAEYGKTAVLMVLKNGGHLSVEASFPLGADPEYIKKEGPKQTKVPNVDYANLAKAFGARGITLDMEKYDQLHNNFFSITGNKPGLTIIQTDTHQIVEAGVVKK
jgi:thiamine pyrophosphate-dependent acetolactate synthase large subunit-like protein